jgi:hypothetical protein
MPMRRLSHFLIFGNRCSAQAGPCSASARAIVKTCARVKQITDFRYVRFHAILHDEVGVYGEDKQGNAIYNVDYVDQIYDG